MAKGEEEGEGGERLKICNLLSLRLAPLRTY